MYKSLNIPLEASQTAIRSGLLRELRVYLALKFQARNGQILISQLDYQGLSTVSGFSDKRTIEKYIQTLIGLNWIGTDSRWLFVRSFERLRTSLNALSRTAVEVTPDDIPHLHSFMLGAKIGHSARAKRYARKKAGAKPHSVKSAEYSHAPDQVSCSLIGEWFGYSASTASRMKQTAKAKGYLTYRHRSEPLPVHPAHLNDYLQATGIDRERVYIRGKKAYQRLTDQFTIGRNGYHEYGFKTRVSL